MEERLRRITLEMESLQHEIEALRQRSAENDALSHNERNEAKSQNACRLNFNDEEKRKMHQDLRNLMDKYEMAKRIGTSSSIDHLLNNTDLPYNAEIMMVPFQPKFKVLKIELYDGSENPIEHLETFKAHMTLHGFPGEIVCQTFPLTLKGVAKGWFGAL